MTILKQPQFVLGSFTLLTLLLAGTAIGRALLGLDFQEAFYLALSFLITIIWLCLRQIGRRNSDNES